MFGQPARWFAIASFAAAAVSACGSGGSASQQATYQLHMDFFSTESGLKQTVDPQVFVAAPGARAGVGPQMIRHAAGFEAARKSDPDDTQLFGAQGSPLGISLGQWKQAAGTVSLTCKGNEVARSTLSGLVPNGVYSVFVVHLAVNGPGRFTPFGNPSGDDNNFTASSTGTATPTDTVKGCLSHQEAIVVIWHSDGASHGSSPGVLGVSWHNSLITQVPA